MKPGLSVKTKIHSLGVFSSLGQCCPVELSKEVEMVCVSAVPYRRH